MQNEILYVCRPGDKKKVMFYNDKSATIDINEDFKKMWRSIAVENMDDEKIEEHLEKQVYYLIGFSIDTFLNIDIVVLFSITIFRYICITISTFIDILLWLFIYNTISQIVNHCIIYKTSYPTSWSN